MLRPARTDLYVLISLHDDGPREGLQCGLAASELAVLTQHHLEVEGLVIDLREVPHRHHLGSRQGEGGGGGEEEKLLGHGAGSVSEHWTVDEYTDSAVNGSS